MSGAGARPIVVRWRGFSQSGTSALVNESAKRALRRGGQTVSAVVATALGAIIGLAVADASAADRLKAMHFPVGTMSLAPSLDRLGMMAPHFGVSLIGHRHGSSENWYNHLTADHPQGAIASVFGNRFGGPAVRMAAGDRNKFATDLKRNRILAAAATQPSGADIPIAQLATASIQLAYADPSPMAVANDALQALSVMAPSQDGIGPKTEVQAELPLAVPLPEYRPGRVIVRKSEPDEPEQAVEPEVRAKPEKKLALAKPDQPADKRGDDRSGFSLRNLFGGGARAGNGVAVYDIAAAKVYMPDGSVLEAHSGVGKMADDPRYTHVKMNGPTPPHTYNLRMRESRFHGVEAIRMLPVDGKNKYGRTGLLTHSYLMRGRSAQSHGCVAFKDYSKFLKAFKAGKIKQLVVVNGGGKAVATRVAKNGRDT